MSSNIPHRNPAKQPRRATGQLGSNAAFNSYSRPLLERLEVYENVYKYDPFVKQSVNLIIDALLGSLGEIEHPNKKVQEFCRDAVTKMEVEFQLNLYLKLKEMIEVTLWSGFSITEEVMLFDNKGRLFFEDLVCYHPASIIIRTDTRGRLIDGRKTIEGDYYTSGVYQNNSLQDKEVKLPLWKIVHLVNDKQFNNHYGTSVIDALYRWHVLQEAFVDMMTVTLDRYGNPLTVYTIPRVAVGVTETDPITGEEREVTSKDLLMRQLNGEMSSTDNNNIILEYFDKDLKPEVKTLTSNNNLAEAYLGAIKYCEKQKIRNLLLPYGLVEADSVNEAFSERQIEVFNRVISSMYKRFVLPFMSQTLHRLVRFNFTDAEGANVSPRMALRKAARPEARVALMQMIKGLSEQGYFNPTEPSDWGMVREMVDALDRPMTSKDKDFIKKIIINPKNPPKPTNTDKPEEAQKPLQDPERDRSKEGKVKGLGGQGRPTGSVTPHQNSRLLNK